jgi:hypothetical protein
MPDGRDGGEDMQQTGNQAGAVVTRREALRRGLLVGAAVWTVPLAQSVRVTSAAADTASAPAPAPGGAPGAAREVAPPGPLAATGADGHEGLLASAGVLAVATGAVLATRHRPTGRHRP